MAASFVFLPVEWHDTLPSTNTWLLDRLNEAPPPPSGTVIAARAQTAGRGRQQRTWETAPDRNLTFSFLWYAPLPPEHLPSMAQAIAVGIARFLEASGLRPAIKWPNDVLVDGKKIAGILCEVKTQIAQGSTAIVAGIGLNVNMTQEEASAIDQPATSLAIEVPRVHAVDQVLLHLLSHLAGPVSQWSTRGFSGIQADYLAYAPPVGAPIRVRDGQRHAEGRLAGFTPVGALRLSLPDGSERVIYSGDLFTNPG